MTLLLYEDDIRDLLPMTEACRLVRESLSSQKLLKGQNLPRRRVTLNHGVLNLMGAAVPSAHAFGLKAYTVSRSGAHFISALWDEEDGRLLALLEADTLGRIRTGAASGVATDMLANPNASTLAVIGCGKQAETQIEAISVVRKLQKIWVYSRNQEHREAFGAMISSALGIPTHAASSAEEAVGHADIVCTITSSAEPVVSGRWLKQGTHINAVGSNWANRREVDSGTVTQSAVVAVDSIEQAQAEAGDLIMPINEGALRWDQIVELGDLLAGSAGGRSSESDITLFKSLGVAVEDVAVARYVYDRAVSESRGQQTSFGQPA